MSSQIQIAPTPTAVREALDAKSALRNGIDPRGGKRVTLRIESRTSNMAICGRIVNYGVNVLPDVHHLDVHEYTRWVDTSTPEELAAVNLELRRRVAERDAARRDGTSVPRVSIEPLAVHRACLRRDKLPFDAVEILSDEPDAPAPAAKAARK
mgnify:CR=1 FL=1